MPTLNVNTSSGVTIPAPGLGQAIKIIGLDLSSNSAVTASLSSNGVTLWQTLALNSATGGQITLNVNKERAIIGGSGQPVALGVNGAVEGSIEYVIVGSPFVGNTTTPGFGG